MNLFATKPLSRILNEAEGKHTLKKTLTATQLVLLGMLLSLAALAFNTALGMCSGQIGRWLQRRPGAARWQQNALAIVMLALAARLLLLERPTTR